MEGFEPSAPKNAVYMDKYNNYENKQIPGLWEYPLDGNLAVSWTTPIVPLELKGKPIIFVIQAGLGTSKGSDGWHELSVNGKDVLKFNTPYSENNVWQGKACSLSFHSLLVDKYNDMMGVMRIEVNSEYIKYGQAQLLVIRGNDNNSRAYFMLFESNAVGINIESVQQENEVSKRIVNAKKVIVPSAPPVEYIAKWHGMKPAAWSASVVPVKASEVMNIVIAGKTESDIRKEIETAVAARCWINEVYPDMQSLQNIPAGHSEWLKALDCVLWSSGPESIQQYASQRKNLKVSLVQKDEAKLLVMLSPGEIDMSSGIMTLQIPLPKTTWKAEVFVDGAKIVANYIHLNDDKGISFDLEVGKSAEIRINQ
jgi:hypothetical protein